MSVLEWSAEFRIDDGPMDEIHAEFVDRVNALGAATGADALTALDALIGHSERHFAEEEAWMAACDFPRTFCHTNQHQGVLQVAREVRVRVAAGETDLAALLATAVGEWFRDHAATMDTMLANFMAGQGDLPHGAGVIA